MEFNPKNRFAAAISLIGTSQDYEDYVSIKIRPEHNRCCCFHCWPNTWREVNRYIYPEGPLLDEGDILIGKTPNVFVLQCHESGPELIFDLDTIIKSVTLLTSIIELIKFILNRRQKEDYHANVTYKIQKRCYKKGQIVEEELINVKFPLTNKIIKLIEERIRGLSIKPSSSARNEKSDISKSRKMIIGITGLIGTGKTAVADIFKKHGAHVISADQIGKEVVEKNRSVLNKLVRVFGDKILTRGGRLRRRELGRIAFSSEEKTDKLNSVVHPPLLKELERRVRQAKKKYELIVVDAALLVYWNWQKKVDLTILIHAGREIRFKRLLKGGLTSDEIKMRTRSQLPYRRLRAAADAVIYNNSSLNSLEIKVKNLLKKIV